MGSKNRKESHDKAEEWRDCEELEPLLGLIYFFQAWEPPVFQNLQPAKEAKGFALCFRATLTKLVTMSISQSSTIFTKQRILYSSVVIHYTPASTPLKHQPIWLLVHVFCCKLWSLFPSCIDGTVHRDMHLNMAKPFIYIYIHASYKATLSHMGQHVLNCISHTGQFMPLL